MLHGNTSTAQISIVNSLLNRIPLILHFSGASQELVLSVGNRLVDESGWN
jgi:hypothetical protein